MSDRMSDERVAEVRYNATGSAHDSIATLALEVQQRRAADLTPDEVGALHRTWRLMIGSVAACGGGTSEAAREYRARADALEKILRAHGRKP